MMGIDVGDGHASVFHGVEEIAHMIARFTALQFHNLLVQLLFIGGA
jgi:hypothetical protein